MGETAAKGPPSLVRGLGAWDGTLITIGSILGSAIFIAAAEVPRAVPHAGLVLLLWLLGGLLTIAGALTYAELGAMTNFSFLEGASHPAELMHQARALGLAAVGVADRNTLAGVVRALMGAEAVDLPLDIYVEAPDDFGGFVRHYEIPELVRVAAPIYLKFGLRNAPNIYSSGSHLEATAIALTRERVRRAALGLGILGSYSPDATTSKRGAQGLAVPMAPEGTR